MLFENAGLVLEGGAMRGLFSMGILDYFLEKDIIIKNVVGISAGAGFGCNYKSGQKERALRYSKRFAKDKNYASLYSLLTTGDLYNVNMLYNLIPYKLDPFDSVSYKNSPIDFYVGATNIESGKCEFHKCENGDEDDIKWFRASASMPLVSRIVEINGKKYLDGGIADSIPISFMASLVKGKIIVILTQPEGFIKEKNKAISLIKKKYSAYPKLVEAMERRHIMYNEEVKLTEKLEKENRVLILRPKESLNLKPVVHDPIKLDEAYKKGRDVAIERFDEIVKFLSQ